MNISTGNDDDLGTLGGRLRAVRLARGLKVGETSKKVGLSRTSWSFWESDLVAKPDSNKLGKFCKLTDISLSWLVERQGNDPEFLVAKTKEKAAADAIIVDGAPRPDLRVPEINPNLAVHSRSINRAPRAIWTIPADIVELGFNCSPEGAVIKRVVTRDGNDFGVTRGDYVLIDTTRTKIDEPGLYLLGDNDGHSSRRALVQMRDGELKIVAVADDLDQSSPRENGDNSPVLGRVMGIFKPV